MEAKDLIHLSWKKVEDWSELSASHYGTYTQNYRVAYVDVIVFVENIYKELSRKLNISYELLYPILKAENEPFYKLLEDIFSSGTFRNYAYSKDDPCLISLENTLRIPDIDNIETVTTDNVSSCIKMFEKLSDIEKTVFLEKIGKINIQVEIAGNQ